MNKKAKQIISILLCLIIVTSLCACGRNVETITQMGPTENEPMISATPNEAAEYEQAEEVFTQKINPFDFECKYLGAVSIGDALLIEAKKDGTYILGLADFMPAEDGTVKINTAAQITANDTTQIDEQRIACICAGEDGYFYVLASEYPSSYYDSDMNYCENPDYMGRVALIKYSANGERLEKRSFIIPAEFGSPSNMRVNKDGRVYISTINPAKTFYIDPNAEDFNGVPLDDGYNIQLSGNKILAMYQGAYHGDESYKIYDTESGEFKDISFNFEDADELESGTVCQGINGEFMVCGYSQIYKYNSGESIFEPLFRYRDYNGEEALVYPSYATELANKCYILSSKENYLLLCGTHIVNKPIKDAAHTINIALYSQSGNQIDPRPSDTIAYNISTYSQNDLNRLLTEVSTGEAPDLIIYDEGLNTNSAYFEDLYPYIDNDSSLSRESFIPNFLQALSVNNQLHEIWTGTGVKTVAVRKSAVEGIDVNEVTPEYLKSIVSGSDKYEAVFQEYVSKENLLNLTADLSIAAFTDKAAGESFFDDLRFAQMLAWCMDMGGGINDGSDMQTLDVSQVIANLETIENVARIKAISENYFMEDYVFIAPFGGNCFERPYGTVSYAIPSRANNKQGAWEYIKSELSEKNQEGNTILPVIDSVLRRRAQAELNDDYVEKLYELLNSTLCAQSYSDAALKDIIMDIGMSYINGEMSLAEAVSNIQSKSLIYMAEQYG